MCLSNCELLCPICSIVLSVLYMGLAAFVVYVMRQKVTEITESSRKSNSAFTSYYVLIALASVCRAVWFMLVVWQYAIVSADNVQNALLGIPQFAFFSINIALACAWYQALHVYFQGNSFTDMVIKLFTTGSNYGYINTFMFVVGTAMLFLSNIKGSKNMPFLVFVVVLYIVTIFLQVIVAVTFYKAARGALLYKKVGRQMLFTLLASSTTLLVRLVIMSLDNINMRFNYSDQFHCVLQSTLFQCMYFFLLEWCPMVIAIIVLHIIKTTVRTESEVISKSLNSGNRDISLSNPP